LNVVICDRLPIVRDGLRTLLDAEPDINVIDTTDSGMHTIMLARTHRPDVILTGLNLRGITGLEMIKRLEREKLEPRPRVVVFVMSDSDEIIDSVLHAEVHGVLFKEVTREELSATVRAAGHGQTMFAPQITNRLVSWYRNREPHADEVMGSILEDVTTREREVLTLMARGLTVDEVAASLSIGVTTVRTHLYRVRCKLNLRDRAQLVSFAYRAGLMRPA
jgi:DNA-binding NarL/FixJ family response regulator